MKNKRRAAKALPLALAALLALLLLCGFSTADPSDAAGAETAPLTAPDTGIEALIEDGEIVESRHNREADYLAAFQTHKLSVGPFTLHMENRIYEEEQLRGKAKALWQDLCALEEAVGEKPGTLTVYLVERTVEGRPSGRAAPAGRL